MSTRRFYSSLYRGYHDPHRCHVEQYGENLHRLSFRRGRVWKKSPHRIWTFYRRRTSRNYGDIYLSLGVLLETKISAPRKTLEEFFCATFSPFLDPVSESIDILSGFFEVFFERVHEVTTIEGIPERLASEIIGERSCQYSLHISSHDLAFFLESDSPEGLVVGEERIFDIWGDSRNGFIDYEI